MKNKVNKYIMLVVGLFLSALSYNLFFKPSNIVVGGVSGLAIIFERLFSIDTSIFILVVNIFLIIISFISLYAIKVSLSIVKMMVSKKQINFKKLIKKYSVVLVICLFLSVISSLIEGYVTPNFIKLFSSLIK